MNFEVGPKVDAGKLTAYAELLEAAYKNGEERGSQMDWNDVQAALDKAIEAVGPEAERYMKDASEGILDEDTSIFFADGTDQTPELVSACTLLMAYRYPEEVEWEDVDKAWEILLGAQPPAPGR